jgi:hypothetical protein
VTVTPGRGVNFQTVQGEPVLTGVEIIRTQWRAPRANAHAERFVRTVRTECLDRIFVVNERHLESVLKAYIKHYNQERPHRGLDLRIPEGGPPLTVAGATGSIVLPRSPRWPYPRIPSEGCLGPSHEYRHCGTRHGANRNPGVYRSAPRLLWVTTTGLSPIWSNTREVILSAVSDRFLDDTLQVQL